MSGRNETRLESAAIHAAQRALADALSRARREVQVIEEAVTALTQAIDIELLKRENRSSTTLASGGGSGETDQ